MYQHGWFSQIIKHNGNKIFEESESKEFLGYPNVPSYTAKLFYAHLINLNILVLLKQGYVIKSSLEALLN